MCPSRSPSPGTSSHPRAMTSFTDMRELPDFITQHVHKDATMERTISTLAEAQPTAGDRAGSGDQATTVAVAAAINALQ